MKDDRLKAAIAEHFGYTAEDIKNFKFFISFNQFGDYSDQIITGCVRYINPNDDNDWSYGIFILHNTDLPSLTFWEISIITEETMFSYEKNTLIK